MFQIFTGSLGKESTKLAPARLNCTSRLVWAVTQLTGYTGLRGFIRALTSPYSPSGSKKEAGIGRFTGGKT